MLLNSVKIRSMNLARYGYYVPREYLIIDSKELIYMPVPKAACTSIKAALFQSSLTQLANCVDKMGVHRLTNDYTSYKLNSRTRAYFKFAFVRDPFERLISCYKDKVKKRLQHTNRYYFDTGYNNSFIQTLFGKKFDPDMSFDEYVRLVARIPDRLADGHFKSQYATLYKGGKIIPDYIGKLEDLEQNWRSVASGFDLPELGIANKTAITGTSEYFKNRETLALAVQRYRLDITLFGYEYRHEQLKTDLELPPLPTNCDF